MNSTESRESHCAVSLEATPVLLKAKNCTKPLNESACGGPVEQPFNIHGGRNGWAKCFHGLISGKVLAFTARGGPWSGTAKKISTGTVEQRRCRCYGTDAAME